MENIVLRMSELVQTHNNKTVTTSLKISEVFEKMHKDVLRDIERLEIPEDRHRLNFAPIFYEDKYGRKQKAFEVTKNGFTLLAFGYSGAKAMQFKLAYIDAFDAMEEELRNRTKENDAKYFDEKSNLMLEKHKWDTEVKRLNTKIQNSEDGKALAEAQKKVSETKFNIEKLETKYFKYRYTLFPMLENE